MSTKAEIIEKLTTAGITHDASATKADLEALLPEDQNVGDGSETIGDIVVGNPQLLRPVELPLVVKPKGDIDPADPLGGWKNKAQARFAATVNAYAYKNPAKFELKKLDRTDTDGQGRTRVIKGLISILAEIGKNPAAIQKYEGNDGGLSFSDKRIQAAAKEE